MYTLSDPKKLHNPAVARWALRLGIAFVFAYAGISSLREPLGWVSYLPHFLAVSAHATTLMELFGFVEVMLAAWVLWGKYVRYAALVSFGLLAGIVVLNPDTLDVTFRDVGLAAMAVALFFSAEK